MTQSELIDMVLNMTMKNCVNDSSYNDNTLHDLVLFGFKGLSNMTYEELQAEYDNLKQWEGV
jgi:hypothetical protein